MKVSFKANVGGREFTITEDCESDTDVFKFMHHMQELFDDTVCSRKVGEKPYTSNQVRVNVREHEDNEYYEMVCWDPAVKECHHAKRVFGQHKKGGTLFPKNKDAEGNWKPWRKYNPETGKEE